MNEKKAQSRKRNQNQTQKKSRDRQAQPEIHLGTSIEVNSRRHFKFSAAAGSPSALRR